MSENKPRLIVVGSHAPGISVRVKRIPVAGETVIGWNLVEPVDGGKGTNQAVAASRLGLSTSFVGCIGLDRLGDDCENLLRSEGVNVDYLFRSASEGTGAGMILLDDNGVPAMVSTVGANGELNEQQIDAALKGLSGAEILLTQFEILPEAALYAARMARRYHMTTIVNPAPAVSIKLADMEAADYLIPNESEAKILLGADPDADLDTEIMAQSLLNLSNAGAVIITAGEQGIIGADRSGVWKWQPPETIVVDTSGAGDAFCAVFAVGLTKGMHHRAASIWASMVANIVCNQGRDDTIFSYRDRSG